MPFHQTVSAFFMGLALVMSLLIPLQGLAEDKPLQPGEYMTEGGWGYLTITSGTDSGLAFVIETVGANGHLCDLDSEIRNGLATVAVDEQDASPCVVTFSPKGHDIEVTAHDSETCQWFCGARAGFEGLYLKPAQGCDSAARGQAQETFKRLYGAKAYAQARAVLEPLLKNCTRTLDWLDSGWLRNDLAVTYYHLGKFTACQRILQPLAAEAAEPEEVVRERYPPADADNYLPVVQAARTNLKLCQGAKTP